MSQYVPKLHGCFSESKKAKLDLTIYTTKSDVRREQVLIHHHLHKKS